MYLFMYDFVVLHPLSLPVGMRSRLWVHPMRLSFWTTRAELADQQQAVAVRVTPPHRLRRSGQ